MNWAVPASTFPKFVELLSLPSYNYNILLGLTVSVGGLTESLVSTYSDGMVVSERVKFISLKFKIQSDPVFLPPAYEVRGKVMFSVCSPGGRGTPVSGRRSLLGGTPVSGPRSLLMGT